MKKVILILMLIVLITGCGGNSKMMIETNMGNMEFELFDSKVPKTVDNFIKLSKEGFYDGVRFHRVIKDFMIQSGDPISKDVTKKDRWGTGGPGYDIKDEFDSSLTHDKKGVLSMANAGPNTGGSQFFVTLTPTPWLDNHHSVFGVLTSGEDVLDKIGSLQVDDRDRPLEDVIVKKISIS
jgi:cyclophilin family peptidyl-prolyl cis-trans isomerase